MKIISIITLTLVTAVFLLSYSAPSYSASFYKCPISYSFQTNGNDSARCFKAERKNFRAPKKCPNAHIPVINKSIGHFLKIDYQYLTVPETMVSIFDCNAWHMIFEAIKTEAVQLRTF